MGLFGKIRAWVNARVQEDELRQLSDEQLKDIGITRYDATVGLKTKRVAR